MRVILHAGMEIVICTQSRRLARALNERLEEGRVEYLHG
jgi:predicted peroxiredoxin